MNNSNQASKWMRGAVFVLGGLATAMMIFLLFLTGGDLIGPDSLGRNIAIALLIIYGGPYLVCVVPAMILSVRGRRPLTALILCLLAVPLTVVLWRG